MNFVVSLIDAAVKMCEPPSRYELAKRLNVHEQNLHAVYKGRRPMPMAWVPTIANLARIDAGQAVLRVLAERAGAKKPPAKVAGFARLSGLYYAMATMAGVSLTPEFLTLASGWLDALRIVSV